MADIGTLVAVYGAALSTILALIAFFRWLLDGPKLLIQVFHPDEYWPISKAFGFVVSNLGRVPIVIKAVEISFWPEKDIKSKQIGKTVLIDQRSQMSPSFRSVPVPNKPNNVQYEPRVLGIGEEYIGNASPITGYDPHNDWIHVCAYARSSKKAFCAWAGPIAKEEVHA